jgi:hypothetical protein
MDLLLQRWEKYREDGITSFYGKVFYRRRRSWTGGNKGTRGLGDKARGDKATRRGAKGLPAPDFRFIQLLHNSKLKPPLNCLILKLSSNFTSQNI